MIPELSIITVNLNNSNGLEKTIQSVIKQSFRNFEFIIIDGNSCDGSIEQIRQNINYISSWISEPDSGVYHAMNKGIKMAQGEYLLFLNSGDCLINEHVLSQTFNFPHIADVLCGKANIWNKDKIIHITNPPDFHTFSTYYYDTINHQATFIRRTLFEKYGCYREDFRINSDWEFWIRTIILNNCTTEKLNLVVANYNIDGLSSNPENQIIIQNEIKQIFSHPLLARFVPDYKEWEKEKAEMRILYWVRKKRFLYEPMKYLYNIAKWIRK
jgi:glycosyltransferase involved in cell wall biosynthesis